MQHRYTRIINTIWKVQLLSKYWEKSNEMCSITINEKEKFVSSKKTELIIFLANNNSVTYKCLQLIKIISLQT